MTLGPYPAGERVAYVDGMGWIIAGLIVAVVAFLFLVVFFVRRMRADGPVPPDVDPMFTMGIALVGAGVALMASAGPGMIGILALGLIFMFSGLRKTRAR